MTTSNQHSKAELPPIPAKRYFTIGEVSELCGVRPHVLRYWEQEFTQLKPVKRRGNRRYYQHHEVLLVRRIRELLYEQGFTISGARNRLTELGHGQRGSSVAQGGIDPAAEVGGEFPPAEPVAAKASALHSEKLGLEQLRIELLSIRELLVS